MMYQLWRREDDHVVEQSFFAVDENYQNRPEPNDPEFQLVWEVEVDAYERAMAAYHEFMDWDPYKPMS